MHVRTIRSVAMAAGLALAVATTTACGSDGDVKVATTSTAPGDSASSTSADGSTTTGATSTSATSSSTTAATGTTSNGGTSTTSAGGTNSGTTAGLGSLPEGSHYGYLKSITAGKVEGQTVSIVGFDKVDLLTGQEAIDAAAAAGDEVDNDYYIRNDNPLIRKLPVIPDSSITILAESGTEQVPSGIDEAVNSPGLYKIEVVVVRGVSLITGVEGVYLP